MSVHGVVLGCVGVYCSKVKGQRRTGVRSALACMGMAAILLLVCLIMSVPVLFWLTIIKSTIIFVKLKYF